MARFNYLIILFVIAPLFTYCQNNQTKGAAISYTNGIPTLVPREQYDTERAVDVTTGKFYQWNRTIKKWELIGEGFRYFPNKPTVPPNYNQSPYAVTAQDSIYRWDGTTWRHLNKVFLGGVSDGDKGDITVSNNGNTWTLNNNIFNLSQISQSNAVTNQTIIWDGNNWVPVDFPTFSPQIDTFLLDSTTLYLSLANDSVPAKTVNLNTLPITLSQIDQSNANINQTIIWNGAEWVPVDINFTDRNGIYSGSGIVPDFTEATMTRYFGFKSNDTLSNFYVDVRAPFMTNGFYSNFIVKPRSIELKRADFPSLTFMRHDINGFKFTTQEIYNTRVTFDGADARYADNYGAVFKPRSLIDRGFADSVYVIDVISPDSTIIVTRDSGIVSLSVAGGGNADGNGIYSGNGTVPTKTTATVTDTLNFISTNANSFISHTASGGTFLSQQVMQPTGIVSKYQDLSGTNQVIINDNGINLNTTGPDRTTITGQDARYAANYGALFQARSLIDRGFADSSYVINAVSPDNSITITKDTGVLALTVNRINFTGDVQGDDTLTVVGIRNKPISTGTPGDGQILKYNNSIGQWVYAQDQIGTPGTLDGVVYNITVSGTTSKTITLNRTEGLSDLTTTFTDSVNVYTAGSGIAINNLQISATDTVVNVGAGTQIYAGQSGTQYQIKTIASHNNLAVSANTTTITFTPTFNFYKTDALAISGGLAVGESYKVDVGNPYGLAYGSLKVITP